jgi:hypothetical protein
MDMNDLKGRDKISKQFAGLGIDGRIDLLLMYYADKKYRSKISSKQNEILEYVFSNYYPRLIEDEGQSHIKDKDLKKHHREHDFLNETLDIMVEENLVSTCEVLGATKYSPTALGHRINERGGWKKHVKREKNNKAIVSTASKTAIISSILTVIIIAFTAWTTWEDKEIHEKEVSLLKYTQQDTLFQKQILEKLSEHQDSMNYLSLKLEKLKHQLSLEKTNKRD